MFLLVFFGALEVTALRQEADIATSLAAVLYAGLGLLFLLLARWWWQDRQKEKAAREALIEKLRREGRELTAPPMSAGKKTWRSGQRLSAQVCLLGFASTAGEAALGGSRPVTTICCVAPLYAAWTSGCGGSFERVASSAELFFNSAVFML